ncbi:MAG: hypothetical protein U0228_22970 [Myxococcaceae bacterium]
MPEAERPADGLSILCLAAGIAAVVLLLFSVILMLGWCTVPLSVLAAATALISGIASLIRTARRPELEGRMQALAGLGLTLVWGGGFFLMMSIFSRH